MFHMAPSMFLFFLAFIFPKLNDTLNRKKRPRTSSVEILLARALAQSCGWSCKSSGTSSGLFFEYGSVNP